MRFCLMAIVALLTACSGSHRPVIMHGQDLQAISDRDLCQTYGWRGVYATGDGPTVRAEVARRALKCGLAGSDRPVAEYPLFSPPVNLSLVGLR